MPNLEQADATAWLSEWRPDPANTLWPPPVRPIETEGDLPSRLAQLGRALDAAADTERDALASSLLDRPLCPDLSAVLAQLGAARTLRILHWLAERDIPDCHRIIGGLLHDDRPAGCALRAAVQAVLRRATLDRMFAPERIAALQTACETTLREAA